MVSSYSPSAGKLCVTTKPPRVPNVRGLDRGRFSIADGLEGDGASGVDVLAHEGRRHLERLGVVVVVALDVVLRQQRRGVDLEREQITHRVGVLAAVQAAHRNAARRGLGGGIDLVREPRNEPVHGFGVGPRPARGRHQSAAQLADGELPGLRVERNAVRGKPVERTAAGHVVAVMALEAVALHHSPLGLFGVGLPEVRPATNGGGDYAERCYGNDGLG